MGTLTFFSMEQLEDMRLAPSCGIFINYLPYVLNVNTFLKSVSTSKSRVTYDLDTDTTMHKIMGVVGSSLYLAMPLSSL